MVKILQGAGDKVYSTLKLLNGDLSFDNMGNLVFIEDREAILQSIFKRLNTRKEDLFYALSYGMPEFDRLKQLDKEIARIQSAIEDCLLDDENIEEVQVIDLRRDGRDSYSVSINVILIDNTMLNLNYSL